MVHAGPFLNALQKADPEGGHAIFLQEASGHGAGDSVTTALEQRACGMAFLEQALGLN